MSQITPETLVGEIAAIQPASIRVFQRYGIDFCCGGKRPLREVCEERRVAFDELAGAIRNAALPAEDRDWTVAPLGELVDHITARYHDTLRHELPRLLAMAAKVHDVHGEKLPAVFPRLNGLLSELSDDLQSHMAKEEMILFPAVKELAAAKAESRAPQTRFPLGALRMPMAVMEQEHERAGELLAGLRNVTGAYEPPEWACNTFRGLYAGLDELERDLHVHVHLENNVLFPRTARLEQES
ncbi:MAG TPA: iron-sulfur cluster repair di-iron protein [Vicinamibacterales bacterium]|nr:iron-sulfur cluster repair di-iron protein [Vicinamibacterales bacterium]